MKEIKKEIIHKSYVTKYEALDGTIFESAEECKKYEASAKCVIVTKYKEIEINLVSEYQLFDTGSEEYFIGVVKPRDEEDVDLLLQVYSFFNPHRTEKTHLQEALETFRKAVETKDCLLIGRGYDYEGYDSFWILGTLTDRLNAIVKACDPGSIIEIKDDLTCPDKQ